MKAAAEVRPNFAPVYAAALYPEWAAIFVQHGYALAVHGSLARDFDLIAVPWVPSPATPEEILSVLTQRFCVQIISDAPNEKPHGRMAYTLSIGFGRCSVDLSFMPRK